MPAHTKAAKRRNRRAFNAAVRAAALKLRTTHGMGLIAAANAAVEDDDRERDRGDRDAQAGKRAKARQTPMQRYLARNEVTRQQYDDAERLWSDWAQSGLYSSNTGSYGQASRTTDQPMPGCGPRWSQYRDAMRAVGIILSPVLAQVVLCGEPASLWAIEHKRPASEGIVTLRLALDALGVHYRGART